MGSERNWIKERNKGVKLAFVMPNFFLFSKKIKSKWQNVKI